MTQVISLSPASFPTRRLGGWTLAPVVVLVLLGSYWGISRFFTHGGNSPLAGAKFFAVAPVTMDVKVTKDGELQAVNNIDVLSQVEGLNTIVQIVKEGAFVKKGEVLVVLDSSTIRQKIEDTSLDVQKAESDLTASKEMLQIQESQNSANLDAASVDVELGKIALQQYVEGTYPQDLANAKTTVEMARITVANKEDDRRQTKELYEKGFVTAADVKAADLTVTTARNDLAKAESAIHVLQKYAHAMDSASKKSVLTQAQQKLARTRKENASNLSKATADVLAKESAMAILKRRAARLQEQLDFCTIKAPADGLVVYAPNYYSSSNNPIQEGTQVRERQQLLRLPDTTSMKAVVKINESQVGRLVIGQRANVKITGVTELVGATLTKVSPVSDSSQRWVNPDLREYPVELVLDNTPNNLKPGIGVTAEILTDSISDAIAVPLASLYSQGADTFVFAREGEAVKPVKVRIGQANETQARITDGLAAGQQVMLLQAGQGRELLEKAGITPAPLEAPKKRNGRKTPPVAAPQKVAAK
jgi:HlyD family secretion protein